MTNPFRKTTWAILALFALLLLLSFRPISDPDIWFYLVQGRELAVTGQIPLTEFYIFPAQGEAASYPALGFGLLYYVVQQAAGFPGMAALNALAAAAGISLMLFAVRQGDYRPERVAPYLIAGICAYLLAEFRFVYRPENILFVFLGTEFVILERWLKTRRSELVFAVLPLVALLSLFHTSAVLLLVVLAIYAVQYCIGMFTRRRVDLNKEAAIAISVIILVGLTIWLNPNGLEQFLVILRSLRAINSDLIEYLPALQTEYRWHFIVTCLLAALALIFAPRRRLVDWLLIAVFGFVAYVYARNIGLFALVIVVPLTRALLHLQVRYAWPPAGRLLAGGLVVFAVVWTFATSRWGVGVDQEGVFVEAAQKLRKNGRPNENLMNFFHHGGYLAWELGPRFKVAIDGHFVQPTFAAEYHDRVFRADPDWEFLLASHDVRYVLTPATLPYSGDIIPLVRVLAGRNDWSLVSVETAGLMFARESAGRELPPVDKREIWQQVLRESLLLQATYPENQGARESIAEAQAMLSRRRL